MTTQELWQSQAVDAPRINPAYLRVRANDTIRVGRRRRVLESCSSVLGVAVAVLIWSWYPDAWMRAGGVWMAVAGIVYSWIWWRGGSASALPADLGALDTLRFHRRELERQRAMYQGLWRWALPLFVPMFALLIYGQMLLSPGNEMYWLTHKVPVVLAGLGVAIGITQFRAAKLRREIELLDLMAK
jgi:hypothetical protein